MNKISKEKLEWMKEIGIKEFKNPMKYYLGMNQVYSEEYISETSLEELKVKYDKRLIQKGMPIANDEDLER